MCAKFISQALELLERWSTAFACYMILFFSSGCQTPIIGWPIWTKNKPQFDSHYTLKRRQSFYMLFPIMLFKSPDGLFFSYHFEKTWRLTRLFCRRDVETWNKRQLVPVALLQRNFRVQDSSTERTDDFQVNSLPQFPMTQSRISRFQNNIELLIHALPYFPKKE